MNGRLVQPLAQWPAASGNRKGLIMESDMALTNLAAIDRQTVAANRELYLECGCESRAEYLAMLAEDYGVDVSTVRELAAVLGPNEDFDGLVTTLEDMADSMWE